MLTKIHLKSKLLVATFLLIWNMALPLEACTLFAATQKDFVAEGGTLVAKNRDWLPQHQELRLVVPAKGYKYYGLFAGEQATFSAAGVNEKGLYVAMSTAGSIPKAVRLSYKAYRSGEGLSANEYMLRYCGSVQEALDSKENFWQRPGNFILADKGEIAYVEVGPDGKKSIERTTRGVIYHTNHYVCDDMLSYNKKVGKSSLLRYYRIEELMTNHPGTFTLEDFIKVSEDKQGGADNSIYRIGSKPNGTQNVGVFIAYLPKQGPAKLYVKYRPEPEDKGKERIVRVNNLSELFTNTKETTKM